MLGATLAELGLPVRAEPTRAWAKEAIFPSDRFPSAADRGPEMRSTGEVMAGGATVSEAYARVSARRAGRRGAARSASRCRRRNPPVSRSQASHEDRGPMGFSLQGAGMRVRQTTLGRRSSLGRNRKLHFGGVVLALGLLARRRARRRDSLRRSEHSDSPEQHVPADDLRHGTGRPDAEGLPGYVVRLDADRLLVPVASVRTGGADCRNISNATDNIYTLTSADIGHRLRVLVTAVNSDGAATAQSKATDIVTKAPPSAPKNTKEPSIIGHAAAGSDAHGQPGQLERQPADPVLVSLAPL